MPAEGEVACPRFVELNMHDIDALEIDEDEYAVQSTSSKRVKTSTPTCLISDGWSALHNISDTIGPAGSAQSPMAVPTYQRASFVPQPTSNISAQGQLPSSAGREPSVRSRLQNPQHGCFVPSLPAPQLHIERRHFSTSSERHHLFQPSVPPSTPTMLCPQHEFFTHQGEQGLTVLETYVFTGLGMP